MALIGNDEHGLKELVMSDADVDDGECRHAHLHT